MNAPEHIRLPDIQSQIDRRNLSIDAVGIEGREGRVVALAFGGSSHEAA